MIVDLSFFWIAISLNYVLIAVGLTLVFSVMRIMNFAHGNLYMAGAFIFYFLVVMAKLPYAIALLLSIAIIGGLGILIEMKLYRPLSHSINAQIVLMIGLMLILEGIAATIFGYDLKDIPSLISGNITIFGFVLSAERATIIVISLIFIASLFYFVRYTKLGKSMRATAQDRYAASFMGINVNLISSLTMGIGCALAALAATQVGAIYYVSPDMGASAMNTALLVVVLGGMGSIIGACVAALIIGFINSFGFLILGNYSVLLSFGIVMLILLIKPYGLFGRE